MTEISSVSGKNDGLSCLSVESVSKRFGAAQALKNVSFSVRQGEIVSLIGPSGCGKSTLLRILAGFETADQGIVTIDGRNILSLPPEKRDIGIVFQDYALFPHLTVLDNIRFAMRKVPKHEQRKKADEYLHIVGMKGFEDRYPYQLSGGQQQRVALARSFAAAPQFILLDEPFSNLDAALRQSTRREIRTLLKATGIGVIFVTHDQEEALSFSDRLCVIQHGCLEQMGTPKEVYQCPVNTFVAGFLGRTNLIPAKISASRTAFSLLGEIEVEISEEVDNNITEDTLLSLRPEHLKLAQLCTEKCCATVIDKEYKGNNITYWVRSGDIMLQIDEDGTCPFDLGDEVCVVPTRKAIILKR